MTGKYKIIALSLPALVSLITQGSLFAQDIDGDSSQSQKGADLFNIREEIKVAPGNAYEARAKIYQKILKAEREGVGVKSYLTAFKYVEGMAIKGDSEDAIAVRLDSISRSLDEQLKRSQILKIQKLPPPIAATSPPPSQSERRSGSKMEQLKKHGLSGDRSQMIDQIKDKWFGGDLPDSVKKKIPPGFDPSKMSKSDIDSLMNRLGK